MAKLVLDDIGSTLTNTAATTINNNNNKIEQALENTLSRDGSTPNNMQADLDMDSNDLLNVDNLHVNTIVIDGEVLIPGSSIAAGQIATQAEAEEGTNNTKIMTPLRTKQSIATELVYTKPTGLVNDYNPQTQVGTDNSAAIQAAFDTGEFVFIPEGNYKVVSADLHRDIEQGGFFGPGRLYSLWPSGRDEQIGFMHAFGIASPARGEKGVGGIHLGGEDGYAGTVLWSSGPSGWASKPFRDGTYSEFNIYTSSPVGTGIGQIGTDDILFTYKDLAPVADVLEPGVDLLGFGPFQYKLKSLIPGGFDVTTNVGGPVNFVANTYDTFRYPYDIRRNKVSVSGTVVTRLSGDFFFSHFFNTNENRIKINGTFYAVVSIQSPHQLTIGTNLGTLTNVDAIQKTHITFTTGFRIQSMFGGREENVFQGITEEGNYLVDLQAYVDANHIRRMSMVISGGPSFDGSGQTNWGWFTYNGKFGMGEDRDTLFASPARINAKVSSSVAQGGAATKLTVERLRASFAGDLRLLDVTFDNDFLGPKFQGRTGAGTTTISLNPEGGNVAVGSGTPNEKLHVSTGAIRVSGSAANFLGSAGFLADFFGGNARLVSANPSSNSGYEWYTTSAGVTNLRMSMTHQGWLVPTIPSFADNAAATAGGLPVGAIYKITGTGNLTTRT